MASLLWQSVFVFLCLELALTLILVIPVPRKIRNWVCRQATNLDLKERLKPALWGVGLALGIAILDCFSLLTMIFSMEQEAHERSHQLFGGPPHRHNDIMHTIDKEKEYKTERNMYLAGFALTLLFVIGRITDLMQEHVDLEDDLEKIRTTAKPAVDSSTDEPSNTSEIEMKPMTAKKEE